MNDFGRSVFGLATVLVVAALASVSVAVYAAPPAARAQATPILPLRVPGAPIRLTITRFGGLNASVPVNTPLRRAAIGNASTARSLAAEINRLPLVTGVYHCPMDDGSHLKLVFTAGDGTKHRVRIGLRGCQSVTAPGAPPGRLPDDVHLLPRIMKLLHGPRGHDIPPPG
jgi:hypothetical protein